MASGGYISANITAEQRRFMKLLDEYEVDIFHSSDIERILAEDFPTLNDVLENLVDKQILSRIERGKFCRQTFRDEKVIGTFIAKESAIAYWSALNLHGLTEQFPNTVFIQTTQNKKDKTVFGVPYRFIRVKQDKRTGSITQGYGSRKYAITDIEKTIVDCFDLPEYSGGYAELLRAFVKAPLSASKMIEYCKAVNNVSVIKRLGFLATITNKKSMKTFIDFAMEQRNETFNLFDPLGMNVGTYNKTWRLRLNLDITEILSITRQEY